MKAKKITKLNKCLDEAKDKLKIACEKFADHIQGNGNSPELKEKCKKVVAELRKS